MQKELHALAGFVETEAESAEVEIDAADDIVLNFREKTGGSDTITLH